jgi:hypothetical protein
MRDAMNDYKLEHIFSYVGRLADAPEIIGPVPEGIRVNFYSAGGEVTGPRIRGKVRPVGGDWVIVRRDGVAYLDVPHDLRNSRWRVDSGDLSGLD